jgi:hypothetical protein
MKKVCLLFYFSLLLTACPVDMEKIIWVRNYSSQTIVVTAEYILPDTMLSFNPGNMKTINANQKDMIDGSAVGDRYLKRMERGERLTVFILSKDSVDICSWEYIRRNNVILKRYEFNAEELKQMGGSVIYSQE